MSTDSTTRDALVVAIQNTIRAIRRHPERVLSDSKPDWSEGLNADELQKLAAGADIGRPILEVTEHQHGGGIAGGVEYHEREQRLTVFHPELGPVRLSLRSSQTFPYPWSDEVGRQIVENLEAWLRTLEPVAVPSSNRSEGSAEPDTEARRLFHLAVSITDKLRPARETNDPHLAGALHGSFAGEMAQLTLGLEKVGALIDKLPRAAALELKAIARIFQECMNHATLPDACMILATSDLGPAGVRGLNALTAAKHANHYPWASTEDGTGPQPEERNDNVIPDPRAVFVICGRDTHLVESMYNFLRSINLDPKEWTELVHANGTGSPYIGEVLTKGFQSVQAVVALHTPDDLAYLRKDLRGENEKDFEIELTGQPRPNVLFETGLALASHPERTVIVQIGEIRPISDISGRHAVRVKDKPGTKDVSGRKDLAQRLMNCGCPVKLTGDDWLKAGDFTPPIVSRPPTSELSFATPSKPPTPPLSPKAAEILKHAAASSGIIAIAGNHRGASVTAGNTSLGENLDHAEEANYMEAVEELRTAGFAKQFRDNFQLTAEGFRAGKSSVQP